MKRKDKEKRKCLENFYKRNVLKIDRCENCNLPIRQGGLKNIAHILPKSKFPSIMCNDLNKFTLCTRMDRFDSRLGCHEQYDKSWNSAQNMKIWYEAVERYKKLRSEIVEQSIILLKFERYAEEQE